MAAPTLVGVTHIDPAVSWESGGHTITSADRPAGTRRGDRLTLFLTGQKQNISTNSPAVWDLSADWTLQLSTNGVTGGNGPFIRIYTARYTGSSVLAQTLTPKTSGGTVITSSNVQDNWHGFLIADRPSHVVGTSVGSLAFNTDRVMPGGPPSGPLSITNPVDGTNIAIASFNGNSTTCHFNGATGYTEIANYAPSAGTVRRCGVSLVHRDAGSTAAGIAGVDGVSGWNKSPFSFGVNGTCAMVALTDNADTPMGAEGKFVGRIVKG